MYSNGFITKSVDDPVTSIQKKSVLDFFFLARALNFFLAYLSPIYNGEIPKVLIMI